MKNLILICLVSLFTTQLLATQSLKATKFETTISTEMSTKDKPIIFENVTTHFLIVEQATFEHLETNYLETFKYDTSEHLETNYIETLKCDTSIKRPKRFKGFNYKKHYKKSKRHQFFNKLLDRDNCNHYREHGY